MKILILEDEINAAKELQRILTELDDSISILSIIDTVEDGIDYLSNNPAPDLIFSDIQLADGMCFEIYNKIQVSSPIIFCTSFDEYTLEAFETNAVSYILKPITTEKVSNALDKFNQFKNAFDPKTAANAMENLSKQLNSSYKKALLIDQRDKIIPLQVKEIAYFYKQQGMVNITTLSNQQYYMTSSLDELERSINPEDFFRANRQFLINRVAVINVERYFMRKLVVQLSVSVSEKIYISKAKAGDFLRWLEGEGGK